MWKITLAVVIVIVLLIAIVVIRNRSNIDSVEFGYLVNEKYPGMVFPQTGEPIFWVSYKGAPEMFAAISIIGGFMHKRFAEYPSMQVGFAKSPLHDNLSMLFARVGNAAATDYKIIGVGLDADTKMPVTKILPAISEDGEWRFVKVSAKFAPVNRLAIMPGRFPTWVSKNEEFSNAIKAGEFNGFLTNLKYPTMQYPTQTPVHMKRWGTTGFIIIGEGEADPKVLIIPTGGTMVFKAFSMKNAVADANGTYKNYNQLVANDGTAPVFADSDKVVDSDSSRWTLTITK